MVSFRCYGQFKWHPPAQGAVIIGDNAQGKTSLLEAICFLMRLQSPRTSRANLMAQHGSADFGVAGTVMGKKRKIAWRGAETQLLVEGEPRADQRAYLADSVPLIWLGNRDLLLVQAGAEARRKYLDFMGAQWHPSYRVELHRFTRALKSRNHLLKHRPNDAVQLSVYTQALCQHGAALQQLRQQLITILQPYMQAAHARLTGGAEEVLARYAPSCWGMAEADLASSLAKDKRYGQTHLGPHRDDIMLALDGHDVAQYASEGQQRTLAIALKLAQSALLHEETGLAPIHLIDDVFGELDVARRCALIAALPADSQHFITTTHLHWLQGNVGLLEHLPVLHLHNGTLA